MEWGSNSKSGTLLAKTNIKLSLKIIIRKAMELSLHSVSTQESLFTRFVSMSWCREMDWRCYRHYPRNYSYCVNWEQNGLSWGKISESIRGRRLCENEWFTLHGMQCKEWGISQWGFWAFGKVNKIKNYRSKAKEWRYSLRNSYWE